MKRKVLSFIAISAIAFGACAGQKKTAQTGAGTPATKMEAKDGNTSLVATSEKSEPKEIVNLAMERTACFGTCPVYRVEMNSDGLVTYTGRYYTEYEGVYTKQYSAKDAEELFSKFEKHRVDTCSAEYNSLLQDVPGVYYYIDYNDKTEQTIANAHFGPVFLKDLSNEMDKYSKVDDSWTKIADKKQD